MLAYSSLRYFSSGRGILRFVDGKTTHSQLPSIAREESINNYTNGLTFSLLQSTDGKCGVWQYFFYDIVSVQGIKIIEKASIILKDPTQNFKVYSTAKGQGNLNPKESVWPDHAVVVYNSYVYDPSYGLEYGAKATAIQSFITQSIESFGSIRKFTPTEDTHGGYGDLYTPLSGSIDVGLFKWI